MSEREFYRLEINIDVADEEAQAKLSKTEAMLEKTKKSADILDRTKINPAVDSNGLTAMEKMLNSTKKRADILNRAKVSPTVRLIDRATAPMHTIENKLSRFSGSRIITLKAIDKISGTVGKIGRTIANVLTSPLAAIGVGGGVAGVTGVGLGMVVEEQDMTSAFEVMLGNRQAAEKRMQELITFAGQTPFTRQDIWKSSRQLELMTRGALSTGDGLRLVGDVAAGTVQPIEEVATWFGRLYDGMASNRPIGEATARLQEMGAISGESRDKLEQLAESGKHISEIWPEAAKEFERFNGLMKKQSVNLGNILLGTKTFFTENVVKKWGQGVADVLQPALMRFRQWRSENKETVKQLGDSVEQFGRRIGGSLVDNTERAIKHIKTRYLDNPEFQQLSFGGKVRFISNDLANSFNTWMDGPGGAMAKRAGQGLGEMMRAGLVVATPALVQVSITVGSAVAKGVLAGFGAALKDSPLGAIIVGALGGAAFGSAFPVVGTGLGALAGAGSGLFAWGTSKVFGSPPIEATVDYGSFPAQNLPKIPTTSPFFESPFATPITIPAVATQPQVAITQPVMPKIPTTSPFFESPFVTPITMPDAADKSQAVTTQATAPKIPTKSPFLESPFITPITMPQPKALATQATTPIIVMQPATEQISGGRGGSGTATVTEKAAKTSPAMPKMDMNAYLNGEVYEPFKEHVNRAESWGRNLIGNFMSGRDSAGMSMGGWLSTKVYEPFRATVNRSESWGRNLMINFQAGINSVQITMPTIPAPSAATAPVTALAAGDILTRPHLGLVAEAGPEAIIPLSSRYRNRALSLYQQVGEHLNVRPYSLGGIAGAVPALAGGNGGGDKGSFGDIKVSGINVSMSGNEMRVDEDALSLRVGRKIVREIKKALDNRI